MVDLLRAARQVKDAAESTLAELIGEAYGFAIAPGLVGLAIGKSGPNMTAFWKNHQPSTLRIWEMEREQTAWLALTLTWSKAAEARSVDDTSRDSPPEQTFSEGFEMLLHAIQESASGWRMWDSSTDQACIRILSGFSQLSDALILLLDPATPSLMQAYSRPTCAELEMSDDEDPWDPSGLIRFRQAIFLAVLGYISADESKKCLNGGDLQSFETHAAIAQNHLNGVFKAVNHPGCHAILQSIYKFLREANLVPPEAEGGRGC